MVHFEYTCSFINRDSRLTNKYTCSNNAKHDLLDMSIPFPVVGSHVKIEVQQLNKQTSLCFHVPIREREERISIRDFVSYLIAEHEYETLNFYKATDGGVKTRVDGRQSLHSLHIIDNTARIKIEVEPNIYKLRFKQCASWFFGNHEKRCHRITTLVIAAVAAAGVPMTAVLSVSAVKRSRYCRCRCYAGGVSSDSSNQGAVPF